MNLFSKTTLLSLQQQFPDIEFTFLDETDSTNNQCKKICREIGIQKRIFVADCQTKGRGRYGREWESVPKTNIYVSFVLENFFRENVAALNLFLGTLLYESLLQMGSNLQGKLTIKWPNDVYIGSKKVAGILIENITNNLDYIVVGIGVNVYSTEKDIPPTATSLGLETHLRENARTELLTILIRKMYDHFTHKNWREKFWLYSNRTQKHLYTYTKQNQAIKGILKKLQENGSIIIEDESGEEIEIIN